MAKLLVATDVDCVALDWVNGFRLYASHVLGKTITLEHYNDWNMASWLGVDDALPLVRAFNSSEAFGALEALPCALDVFPAMAAAGHPIVAITACADDEASHQLRIRNLERVFGPIFDDVLFVPLGGDKTPHLRAVAERYGTGLWLEDNHKNALAGANVGFETYLVRRPHNKVVEQTCNDLRLNWIDDLHPVARRLGLLLENA
jgi:hypothetical protein